MKYPIMSYMCTYIICIVYKPKFAFQIYNSMLKATSTSVCTTGFFSVPELPLSASLFIHLSKFSGSQGLEFLLSSALHKL